MEQQRKASSEAEARRPDEPELEETEFDEEESPLGFAATKLPWLIGAVVLLAYLVTLNRWLRVDSVSPVCRALGWNWDPQVSGPLSFLLTLPFRGLPGGLAPLALNLLTAIMAGLSVALLVRCVALLPYDRTREARQRERSEYALLSLPLAWAPAALGGLALAFTLTFWEHATAYTGEMLDLLLFAWIVHSLLSFRIHEREGTLYQAALVYGLAITNNYAMIAFLPAFVLALVWIRGFAFFRLGFLARMLLLGVAGLLLYLLLPGVEALAGKSGIAFGQLLRSGWAAQKEALGAFPPYRLILIGFSTLLPVFLMGVRWPANLGDTSAAGLVAATFVTRLMHGVMLAAALSALLDARWGPRVLGGGHALLPLYFLAALAAGYYSGYLLLIFGRPDSRSRRRHATPSPLSKLVVGVTLAVAVAAPGYLLAHGFSRLRARNGKRLADFAQFMVHPLPKEGAYVLSDNQFTLLLARAALYRERRADGAVMIKTAGLPYRFYHDRMARWYPKRWPALPETAKKAAYFPKSFLVEWVARLAASNQVFYLHPSSGYFFEAVYLAPRGLIYQVRPLPPEVTSRLPLRDEEIQTNEAFWDQATRALPSADGSPGEQVVESIYVGRVCSRALDWWAVRLQRNGRLPEAAHRFEQALAYAGENLPARLGHEFNQALARDKLPPLDLTKPLDIPEGKTLNDLLSLWGPFDHPRWTFQVGHGLVGLNYFRQALFELGRVYELYPSNAVVEVVFRNTRALALLSLGREAPALADARALVKAHPGSDLALETLTQVYLYQHDLTNALSSVKRQLALNPDNTRALLNQGAILIQLKDYEGAIAAMNHLLTLDAKNQAARLNRAIARLQSGQLDAAREDYEVILKSRPRYYGIYYGLGEIAWRQQRKADALQYYRKYLQYAPPGTTEYQEVARRVKELGG